MRQTKVDHQTFIKTVERVLAMYVALHADHAMPIADGLRGPIVRAP